MVSKSFKQFQFENQHRNDKQILRAAKKFLLTWEYRMAVVPKKLELLRKIQKQTEKIMEIEIELQKVWCNPMVCLPYLTIGRMVLVSGLGWCPIINFSKVDRRIFLEVFTVIDYHTDEFLIQEMKCNCKTCLINLGVELAESPKIVSVPLERLRKISTVVMILPESLIERKNREIVKETVFEMVKSFTHDVPLLKLGEDIPIYKDSLGTKTHDDQNALAEARKSRDDARRDLMRLNIQDITKFKELSAEDEGQMPKGYSLIFKNPRSLKRALKNHQIFKSGEEAFWKLVESTDMAYPEILKNLAEDKMESERLLNLEVESHLLYFEIVKQIKDFKGTVEGAQRIVEHEKVVSMKQVVCRKDFLDEHEVVKKKGRVAAHIYGADELLITEIMLQGLVQDVTPADLPVLFSVFVNEERVKEKAQLPSKASEAVMGVFEKIRGLAKELAEASKESGLDVDVGEVVSSLNPSLMDTVQQWVEGATFAEICGTTEMYEGSIIRSIKRLYEMLKQLSSCGDVLGNKKLKMDFDLAAEKLNRGIVFAASLYV